MSSRVDGASTVPLLDRVTAPRHAGTDRAVKGRHLLRHLLLIGLLLPSGSLIHAPLAQTSSGGPSDSADGSAFTRIPRDRANSRTDRSPSRGALERTALLWLGALLICTLLGDCDRVDTGRLLRPKLAGGGIRVLLLRALSLSGIDDRLLRER